jgi:hypothetical protein
MVTNMRDFRNLKILLFQLTWFQLLWFTCSAPLMVQAQESQKLSGQSSDPIAIYKEAGVDPGQAKKILGLANAYESTQDKRAHELIAHLKHVRALSMSPSLDERSILETQMSINKLQNQMAMDKVHLLINIRRILNQTQRAKLVTLLHQRNQSDAVSVPDNGEKTR